MWCKDCNKKAEYKKFATFSYYYCKDCKKEIELDEEADNYANLPKEDWLVEFEKYMETIKDEGDLD